MNDHKGKRGKTLFTLHGSCPLPFQYKSLYVADTLLAKSITGNIAICQAFLSLFSYLRYVLNTSRYQDIDAVDILIAAAALEEDLTILIMDCD